MPGLDALGIDRAHLVGLSMGGFTALHTGLRHPDRVRSLAIAGVGYGTAHDDAWKADVENLAAFFADDPEGAAASHGSASVRVPFMVKDRRGWQEFADALAEHPAAGSANTLRRVQARRPNLYGLEAELAGLEAPLLVMAGDEDEPCLGPSLWLKRTVPMAGLVILPRSAPISGKRDRSLVGGSGSLDGRWRIAAHVGICIGHQIAGDLRRETPLVTRSDRGCWNG